MSILARFQNHQVEVLDVYQDGAGVKMATVKALDCKPFMGGDKWPVHTEFGIVKACELEGLQADPQPAKTNLLTMALANAKDQWYAGESVWLWRSNGGGAFLKEEQGLITLNVTGYIERLVVFLLDLQAGEWKQARNLEGNYHLWAAKAREVAK